MHWVVGFLITMCTKESSSEKGCVNLFRFDRIMAPCGLGGVVE